MIGINYSWGTAVSSRAFFYDCFIIMIMQHKEKRLEVNVQMSVHYTVENRAAIIRHCVPDNLITNGVRYDSLWGRTVGIRVN